ncbi:hypothetical protein G7Y79_00012g032120 [Physcia stellaris]|nr:hypothetical protein G7Y79_00012g032120 [Physcia stellaris]
MHGLPLSDLQLAQQDQNGVPANTQTILSPSAFSPVNDRPSSRDDGNGRKRNSSTAGLIASPSSAEDGLEGGDGGRRLPGVKRACNECRQQKLRCDVIQEPTYIPCKRCQRLNLDCKIDANFRRVGKRHKNAEMEKELRGGGQLDGFEEWGRGGWGRGVSEGANGGLVPSRRIEGVVLSQERIRHLFLSFFTYYHPWLPMLDPLKSPDDYYAASPLLFWVVVAVAARRYDSDPTLLASLAGPVSRLLWATLESVPQSYIVVKALCIICTWPMPISSTSADPTFMLSGMMMQIAMQIGLHRPSHAQDFTKFKVELRAEELKDRVRTWASCNAVAQRVATGYGQPPATHYDWTLAPHGLKEGSFKLPEEAEARLLIERFCNKVTQILYSNDSDPVGLPSDIERSNLMRFLATDLQELEATLKSHTNPTYDYSSRFQLVEATQQLFANQVDLEYGKTLFKRAIWMIRTISVSTNDLPSRLAEVLAQLWSNGGAGSRIPKRINEVTDSSLQLKVRCRMSMSLVYDSVWRWREEFQAKGKGNLESAVSNPTNLDSAAESSTSSAIVEPAFAHPALLSDGNLFGDANYEVFDPLSWTLDGLLDFPFGYPEGSGVT